MQLIVDSLLVNYEIQGDNRVKKTILLVPGWGDTLVSFRTLASELAQDYTVISVDLPGFGRTQQPQTAWGLGEYARFIGSFLKKLNNTKLYAIIGHSNGGSIAIHGLAIGAFTAEKLLLIATAGIRTTTKQKLHRRLWQPIAKVGKIATILLPGHTRQRLRQQLYKAIGSDMLVAEHMQETFKRVVGQDVREDAARLRIPTLLLYGDRDNATPLSFARLFSEQISGSKLVVIEHAGHFVHLEQPQKVMTEINKFLQ